MIMMVVPIADSDPDAGVLRSGSAMIQVAAAMTAAKSSELM